MKAKFKEFHNNARNMAPKKETMERRQLVVSHKGKLVSPVDVRFYMGRSAAASVVYCSVWIRTTSGHFCSGHGSAGGGGYHKASAALADALESAGIELSEPIDGYGDDAMSKAMKAVARAGGYRAAPLII